jgi:hypothetical protein
MALRAKSRAVVRAIALQLGREHEQLVLPGVASDEPGSGARRRRGMPEAAPAGPARQQLSLRDANAGACRECGRRNYHLIG